MGRGALPILSFVPHYLGQDDVKVNLQIIIIVFDIGLSVSKLDGVAPLTTHPPSTSFLNFKKKRKKKIVSHDL